MSTTRDQISRYLAETFDDVERTEAMGYAFFFVGDDRMRPFVTVQLRDNEHDAVSQLDGRGVIRVNVGVSPETYRGRFGKPPKPGPDGVVAGYDFSALDVLMPHPHYAQHYWVCVVGPSEATFEALKPLFAEAHALAVERHSRRESP